MATTLTRPARTDRNNNPTAMTTDVARQGGLVEGVDFVQGDAFPDNPNLHTAKLLGDPYQQTKKVLDTIGFYTQSGAQRWSHTAIPSDQWMGMPDDQKSKVIASMYQKEGGSGALASVYGATPDVNTQPKMQTPLSNMDMYGKIYLYNMLTADDS